MPDTQFFAYSSHPEQIGLTIELAAQQVRAHGQLSLQTWRQLPIPGNFIASEVRQAIDKADILVADVSVVNFNVYYEIGFGIGRGKRLLLVRNRAIPPSPEEREMGLLDSLGVLEYENAQDLLQILETAEPGSPLRVASEEVTRNSPAFLLESRVKSDNLIRIRSRIKKARISFRSFDPAEEPRLSALSAIREVSRSVGVVAPLLLTGTTDAAPHNLRAAFIGGVADGLGRALLLLQEGDSDPIPLDYRDIVVRFKHPDAINDAIADFSARVMEELQSEFVRGHESRADLLSQLRLGATAAENELADLGRYYLETDAFLRATRGEVRLVVGRKGSGKTALFAQLRDRIRQDRAQVVLDLKPEGFKLRKFKEDILHLLDEGTLEHTITAFWEYLLLLEVCYKLLEKDRQRHTREGRLFEPYRQLADSYSEDELIREGDFSERLTLLLNRIREQYSLLYGEEGRRRLTGAEVTNLLYRHDINRLRAAVERYLAFKGALWVLFDNLDKGWPTHGLEANDLVVLRTLLDATRKIQNDLQRKGKEAYSIVFLRRDVYDLLIEETPDRGKEAKASVDWTQPELLRELIRRRLSYSGLPGGPSLEALWAQVCVALVDGEETLAFMIERSLMRPRSLLTLLSKAWGIAVNLGHRRIEGTDILRGVQEYSSDLVYEIGLEIRDVMPTAENALYCLIESPPRFSKPELERQLSQLGADVDLTKLIRLLLWFGVVGVVGEDDSVRFIWDFSYEEHLLAAWMRKRSSDGDLMMGINPAFWAALGIAA